MLRTSSEMTVKPHLTFFGWTLGATFPAFLDRIVAAKLWTLDKGTVDLTIIAFAFWRAGAWRPPFAVFMKNPVIIAI